MSTQPDALEHWVAVLDELQAHLTAHRSARRAGDEPPAPLAVPDIDIPIPAALVPRAETLLDLLDREIGSRERERTAVRRALAAAQRARPWPNQSSVPTVRAFESRV